MEDHLMVKKRIIQETTSISEPVAIEYPTTSEDSIRKILEETKTEDGVIGYIMRNAVSASIDLRDPARMIDYALLSSSAFDASEGLSSFLDLGDLKSIVVETKNVKMLSLNVNGSKVSIFAEKHVDLDGFQRKLGID
jgi:predicted regulator of Ras-like GTPase activity (Roadblock/LC7/MglB family)